MGVAPPYLTKIELFDTPWAKATGILGSSSPLNIINRLIMPEMILSSARKQTRRLPPGCNCCERFLLLCRSQFPSAPRYCRKTQILVSLYLVLKAFTCASLPTQNAIALEFIGALPLGTGFLKRLNTLTSVLNNITYLRLSQSKSS